MAFSLKPAAGNGPFVVQKVLALSATVSAALVYTVKNPGYARGIMAYLTIHSFPASASTTVNLAFYAQDPATGANYPLNAPGTARSATGTTLYMLGSGLTIAGNSVTNCLVPQTLIINLSLSTGATSKDCLFSLGIEWTP